MSLFDEEFEHFVLNFMVAGFTATAAKTVTAPLDRIKIILQNQDAVLHVMTKEIQPYKGIIDCLKRLPKEQGLRSFWRGNGVNLIRYFPTQALNFAFNDFFKPRLHKRVENDSPASILFGKFLAGGLAGGLSTAIVYPLEFCQTRVCADVGSDKQFLSKETKTQMVNREFSGLSDCVVKISKAEGLRGLYKGFCVAVVGISIYRGMYFSLFDVAKRLWQEEQVHTHHEVDKPHLLISLLMAQIVTCIASICGYPLDTVGRRLMLEAGRPKELQVYKTTWGAFKTMYKTEGGIRPFFKGVGANFLRSICGALVLVFYDEVFHYTEWKKKSKKQ